MTDNTPVESRRLIKDILQPGVIALTAATFFIGVGVAHYLGSSIQWLRSIFTCISLFFLIWARNTLAAYFDHPKSPFCILRSDHPRYKSMASTKRNGLLTYSLLFLTAAVTFAVLVLVKSATNGSYVFLLTIIFAAFFFSSVPPVNLQRRGYGELTEGLTIGVFIPAIALALNYGKVHPVLEMLVFPLFFVYLSTKLAFTFRTYLEDKAGGNPNLLNRLDWSRSMSLHNILIIIGYLFIPVFTFFGLSWSLAWPMLLTLPIAIFEIVQILNILNGAKPNWTLFEWTAGSQIGILCYLVLLTLWLH
jgi:1,4-dihydroxy-2-naphthoate octaprenyltransferase